MGIGNELKKVREQKNLTRQQVAELLSIPYTTLSNYENNSREPNSDFLRLFSQTFDVTIDSLLGIAHKYISPEENQLIKKYRELDAHGKESVHLILDHELVRCENTFERRVYNLVEESRSRYAKVIPLSGKVSAGQGIEAIEEYDTITGPAASDFALIVDGDSMEPRFHDGEVVFIKRQPQLENGEIGVVQVFSDNDFLPRVFLKKVKMYEDHIDLISLNPSYEPLRIAPNEISIIGTVLDK